ncbi:uncharacterized protein LOC111709127 [Eurytemora carolleeae]|uniref:uncharacterized protein LOC111709127 n=1 Tax=Eurytemora carolleeae TaxID=1294199 RepID=UPI000C78D19A|nr:uncharacterized protein LOC111709127 [Eurytemora carolleeae]|eukprot:XP_023338501.1 uncharacterized protein LOC111709127 [Eurytemora affinis]
MFKETGLLFLLFISPAVSAPQPQDSLEDIVGAIGDCVPGFELKEGQGCFEIKEESIDDLFDCESGLELKEGVGCVPIECPPGTEFLVQTNGCTEKCSASEEYNKDTDQCDPKCSSDLEYNSERMTCVPKDVCTDPLEIGKLVSNSQEDGFDLRIGDNCEKRSCAAYADQGFVCVPFHICRNRTIVTDGSKLLDIRVDDDEDISANDDESCCVNRSGIIDVSDSKCRRGEVCCLNPDYRLVID